jgi:hypothetical protein
MRSMKYALMACAVAALVGCTTTYHEDEAAWGRPGYRDTEGLVEGANRGVNTNYFAPVNASAEAALGPGYPSGGSSPRP